MDTSRQKHELASESAIRETHFKAGSSVVVKDSENPGYFFLVRSGRLQVDSEHRFQEKHLSRFDQGDSFGLVSAMTGHRFLATVFAAEDSVVLRIPVSMLGAYLKRNKHLALKMLGLYCRELKALHHHLARVNPPHQRKNDAMELLPNVDNYLDWGKPAYAAHALRNFIQFDATAAAQTSEALISARARLEELKLPEPSSTAGWSIGSRDLENDSVLFLENESGSEMYVVESGTVKLFKIVRGQEFIIDVLGPGELIGEMSFINQAVRMASAVTQGPARIMRVEPDHLFDAVGESILQKIIQSLARRIWMAHRRLSILRMEDPILRLYSFLSHSITDQLIKAGKNPRMHLTGEFEVPASLEELITMCGILNLRDATIAPFLKDTNLVLGSDGIRVLERRRLEEHISRAPMRKSRKPGRDHLI